MNNLSLIICAKGDPYNHQTWSGTARNLTLAIQESYAVADAIDFSIQSKLKEKIINGLSKLYYQKATDYSKGLLKHLQHNKVLRSKISHCPPSAILHISNYGLPLKQDKVHKHFVYMDYTSLLWYKNLNLKSLNSKKMIEDSLSIERKGFANITHFFVISSFLKDHLINDFHISPNKITIVGTGTGIIEPYFGKKDYTNYKLLFIAKQRFLDKGGKDVIELFEKLYKADDRFRLTIIGLNEITEKIKHSAIEVYDTLSIQQMQSVFNEHSLYVMPALYEPWGLVYLEALICKMPIVGLNRNAFPEIAGGGKFGFIVNDLTSTSLSTVLSNTIREAFYNPSLLEKMGLEGQQCILDNFTWESVSKKIVNGIKKYYE